MPTYIGLLSMEPADHGIKGETLSEGAPETRNVIESHGGTLHEIYLTMGQYDAAIVMDFPNSMACAKAMLALRERLGGTTQTLEAFPSSQWPELAQGI